MSDPMNWTVMAELRGGVPATVKLSITDDKKGDNLGQWGLLFYALLGGKGKRETS